MQIDADADNGINFASKHSPTASMNYGIRMDSLILRSGGAGILLRNNMPIASKNLAGAQVSILTLNSSDVLVHRAGGSATGAHEFRLNEVNDTVLGVFDSGIADAETSLWVRRNVGGTFSLQRVTMGPADSGGTGYRVLRVLN